jgi:hypothetical protein
LYTHIFIPVSWNTCPIAGISTLSLRPLRSVQTVRTPRPTQFSIPPCLSFHLTARVSVHKIPEQRIEKPRNQGATKSSHIWHCTRISGSTVLGVQNIYHEKHHLMWPKLKIKNICNIIYHRKVVYFRYIIFTTLHISDR